MLFCLSQQATVLCYLHPHYDGKQPGACPTMYFRDGTSTLKDVKQHNLWVALEAGAQHAFFTGGAVFHVNAIDLPRQARDESRKC